LLRRHFARQIFMVLLGSNCSFYHLLSRGDDCRDALRLPGRLLATLSAFLVIMMFRRWRLALRTPAGDLLLSSFAWAFHERGGRRYRRYQRRSQLSKGSRRSARPISRSRRFGQATALFANMDEGFAAGEMLYDDSGAPCDYLFSK